MHVAARYRKVENITALVRAGADPNERDKSSYTPLHRAARSANPETIAALVRAGAELETREFRGWTPLRIAMESNRLENQHALLEAGADPDSVDDGDAWQSLEDRAEARLKAAQAGQKVTFKADCSGWNNYHFSFGRHSARRRAVHR